MTAQNPYDAPLTDEQRAVVEQPVEALVCVTAGPGAGKTHTLIRRLGGLVDRDDVYAGEILVLTFSRAAVRELRTRLARHGGTTRHIRAYTFDSWVLELLTSVRGGTDWRSHGFDARIEAAVDVIRDGGADDFCDPLRQIAVDEVQDLVGVRRRLVEELLERFEVGFTVVGDPAQAIYGFQVQNRAERARETNLFFANLRRIFRNELVELELTRNFRVREESAAAATPFGPDLRAASDSAGSLLKRLRHALQDTAPFGNLYDDFVHMALTQEDVSTALLCRTNGQALLASEQLRRANVRHELRRSVTDRVVPAWIGTLVATQPGSTITYAGFVDTVGSLPLNGNDDPEQLWDWLVRATARGSGSRTVDIRVLRNALARGALSDELTDQPDCPVVVSSIHRAKGLEFDRVLVMDPGPPRKDEEFDPAEEARILYVAMTRARDDITWIDLPRDVRSVDRDRNTERWTKHGYQHWQRTGMEIRGDDVSAVCPPGAEHFVADCVELQRHLVEVVRPGDDVKLHRLHEGSLDPGESPPYLIVHDNVPVGTASHRFRQDLHQLLSSGGAHEPKWPTRITRVHIDVVATVSGSEAASGKAGLGAHGIWLVPRLAGLSSFDYGGGSAWGDQ